MFFDETANTYFRRLSFSPDGAILFTPTAFYKKAAADPPVSTVYAYICGQWNAPAFHLPMNSNAKPSVAVRCSPILYKLKECSGAMINPPSTFTNSVHLLASLEKPVVNLPYRVVYAVATIDTVLIYDTQVR